MTYYDVLIRKNSTGEIRRYRMEDCAWEKDSQESGGTMWVWMEGNFSCDCNRELFFMRAAGEEDPENHDCGDSRFDLMEFILPDGSHIDVPDGGHSQ